MLEQHGAVARRAPAPNAARASARAAPAAAARAAARSAGLEKRVSPSASVWSAPSTSRPGMRRGDALRLGAGQQPRRGERIVGRALRFHRALVDVRRPYLQPQTRAAQDFRAHLAFRREHQRPAVEPKRQCFRLAGWRRRSVSNRITAAAVSSIERRVTSIDGQLFLAQSRRENGDLLGHRRLVDVLVVGVVRLQAEQAVLADLHDALRAGIKPDHQRPRQLLDLRRQRHARHQRHVAGLDAAIGKIDRGRRLRGARDADQNHVRLCETFGVLAVVVEHRVVERVDAVEIFGVEHVLGAGAMDRFGTEIGLEQAQHRARAPTCRATRARGTCPRAAG